MLIFVFRVLVVLILCLVFIARFVFEVIKVFGCLVWVLITFGLVNRLGWVEGVDKRFWFVGVGGFWVGFGVFVIYGMRLLVYLLVLYWFGFGFYVNVYR